MSKKKIKVPDLSGARFGKLQDKIIIHHTATKRLKKYDVEWCRALHKGKGWYDIGYHFYVEADGTINLGRPLHKVGAHCLGQNVQAIGIAFVGGLDSDGEQACTISPTQQRSVAMLIKELREHGRMDYPVYSHNQLRDTFCPGFDASEVDWDSFLDDGAPDPEPASKADLGAAS